MSQLLVQNCYIPERVEKKGKRSTGMRLQVPWGKHTPATWRFKNKADQAGEVPHQEHVLPAVVIKDPFTWMTSMCRHTYSAYWYHTREHCPNLVWNNSDLEAFPEVHSSPGDAVPVHIRYTNQNITHHKSLANLWNDYYSGYINADFPLVIIRFEDLLFRAEGVVNEVCKCAGGQMREKFTFIADSAKKGEVHK